jgi:hypothetical protein
VDGSSQGARKPWNRLSIRRPEELIMLAITTVGLDIAKSVFQIHGIDTHGIVVVRRPSSRAA